MGKRGKNAPSGTAGACHMAVRVLAPAGKPGNECGPHGARCGASWSQEASPIRGSKKSEKPRPQETQQPSKRQLAYKSENQEIRHAKPPESLQELNKSMASSTEDYQSHACRRQRSAPGQVPRGSFLAHAHLASPLANVQGRHGSESRGLQSHRLLVCATSSTNSTSFGMFTSGARRLS